MLKYKIIPNTTNAIVGSPFNNEGTIEIEFSYIIGWKIEYVDDFGSEMASPIAFNYIDARVMGVYYPNLDTWTINGKDGITMTGKGKSNMEIKIIEEYNKYEGINV